MFLSFWGHHSWCQKVGQWIYPIVFSTHNWIYFVNTNGRIIMYVFLQCSLHKIQAFGWSFLSCRCEIRGQIGTCKWKPMAKKLLLQCNHSS
jgi:hypothetical protein